MRLFGANAPRFVDKYSMTKRKQIQPTQYTSSDADTAVNGNYAVTLDFTDGARAQVQIEPRPDRHSWDNKSFVRANTPVR